MHAAALGAAVHGGGAVGAGDGLGPRPGALSIGCRDRRHTGRGPDGAEGVLEGPDAPEAVRADPADDRVAGQLDVRHRGLPQQHVTSGTGPGGAEGPAAPWERLEPQLGTRVGNGALGEHGPRLHHGPAALRPLLVLRSPHGSVAALPECSCLRTLCATSGKGRGHAQTTNTHPDANGLGGAGGGRRDIPPDP